MDKSSGNTVQAFWVLLGSISAFGLAIVSSVLLSRYFSKEDYGTYKQVMYIYNTLLVVFTLGLPRAYSYFLPKVETGEAKNIINKINFLLIILGSIMSIAIFFGADFFATYLRNPALSKSLKYFSLVPLFMLPTMGLEGILSTYKQTIFLAIYTTITKIFMLLCVVIPVIYFNGDVNSAIIGFTISSFLCSLSAVYFKNRPLKGFKTIKSNISFREIFAFALPLMGASVWGILINSADEFFISRYFGNETFADFANGSLELPFVSMVIASSATVLLPVFVRQIHNNNENATKEIFNLWNSVLSKTIKIIYPLVVFCFCFADILMIVLYGEKYKISGVYFQIKLFVNFFTIISYSPLMLAIGGERYYFKVHMYGAILLIFLEWISIKIFNSPYLITAISVVCQIGRIIAMLLFISKFFKVKFFDLFPIKLALEIVIPSILYLFFLRFFLINQLLLNHFLILLLGGVSYIVFLFFWARYKKINYLTIIQPLIDKIKK